MKKVVVQTVTPREIKPGHKLSPDSVKEYIGLPLGRAKVLRVVHGEPDTIAADAVSIWARTRAPSQTYLIQIKGPMPIEIEVQS